MIKSVAVIAALVLATPAVASLCTTDQLKDYLKTQVYPIKGEPGDIVGAACQKVSDPDSIWSCDLRVNDEYSQPTITFYFPDVLVQVTSVSPIISVFCTPTTPCR